MPTYWRLRQFLMGHNQYLIVCKRSLDVCEVASLIPDGSCDFSADCHGYLYNLVNAPRFLLNTDITQITNDCWSAEVEILFWDVYILCLSDLTRILHCPYLISLYCNCSTRLLNKTLCLFPRYGRNVSRLCVCGTRSSIMAPRNDRTTCSVTSTWQSLRARCEYLTSSNHILYWSS